MPRRPVSIVREVEGDGREAVALDLSHVVDIVAQAADPASGSISVLQRLQRVYGYLPEPVVAELARLTGVPASRIYGVATFYNEFRLTPIGKHLIHVCHGTACHVAGATLITQALEDELGVDDGATTPDMAFTLGSVACMGACSQAPVMRIGETAHGNLTPDKTRGVIRGLMAEEAGGDGRGAAAGGDDAGPLVSSAGEAAGDDTAGEEA